MAKEIPTALVRATTVFISYLAAMYDTLRRYETVLISCFCVGYRSQDVAADKSHKTITAAHVLEAVQLLDWDDGKDVSKMLNKELKGARISSAKISRMSELCLLVAQLTRLVKARRPRNLQHQAPKYLQPQRSLPS